MGLEDVALEEVRAVANVRRAELERGKGRLFLEASSLAEAYKILVNAKTVDKVILKLLRARAASLEEIYERTVAVDFSELFEHGQSFAVRTERIGKHDFTSLEISAKVGRAVLDSTRKRVKVDLKQPDVELLAYLRDSDYFLGVNLTGKSMHARGYRVYDHPAALKTTIAQAMVRLVGWDGSEPLIDPMCGGGTIATEAVLYARSFPIQVLKRTFMVEKLAFHDEKSYREAISESFSSANLKKYPVFASDISEKHVSGAILNALSSYTLDSIVFKVLDATKLHEKLDFEPKYVVVNPPYGIRMTRLGYVPFLYRAFLRSLKKASKDFKLSLITPRAKLFGKIAEEEGLSFLCEKGVMHGNLPAKIFVCEFSRG